MQTLTHSPRVAADLARAIQDERRYAGRHRQAVMPPTTRRRRLRAWRPRPWNRPLVAT